MFTVIAACIVLLVSLMLDSSHFKFIVKPELQVIIGTCIVAVLLFDNAASGFILGLSVIIMYMRVHARDYGMNLDIMSLFDGSKSFKLRKGGAMNSLVKKSEYISPENLKDAQNNVVSPENYNEPVVGLHGTKDRPVYGAQGTDSFMPGYDGRELGSAVKQ